MTTIRLGYNPGPINAYGALGQVAKRERVKR